MQQGLLGHELGQEPSHAGSKGSPKSFQARRSCLGRNTELSPLMCAGRGHVWLPLKAGAPSALQTAVAAKLAAPQHVEPEPLCPNG